MAENQEGKKIRIRQVRSAIGTKSGHREVLRGLGLRRIRHEVVREDTPAVRGMVNKVSYLLEVREEQS
jgi:large subunit ribosomal protein L30